MMLRVSLVAVVCLMMSPARSQAEIVEIGQRNIIRDTSSPIFNTAFLDMSISVGQTAADAIAAAELLFPDPVIVRLATPEEFDLLLAASTLELDDPAVPPSVGLATETLDSISSGANYNTSLRDILGTTLPDETLFFTNTFSGFFPQAAVLGPDALDTFAFFFDPSTPDFPNSIADPEVGWLLVAVPEPTSTWLLLAAGTSWAGVRMRRRRKSQSTSPVA